MYKARMVRHHQTGGMQEPKVTAALQPATTEVLLGSELVS